MSMPALFGNGMKKVDREFIFSMAEQRTSLPAFVIEKDYILCIVLSIIFEELKESCHVTTPFLFKGGTTLSKVYDLIDRMSEDIDLSISMEFLGYPEPEEESNSARTRRVDSLKIANQKFVSEKLKSILEQSLNNIADGFEVLIDETESQNIIIHYPKSLDDDAYGNTYIQPRIFIETGGRASFHPHECHNIEPIVSIELQESLHIDNDCLVSVDVLSKERTFFEKLTLLHELNSRGKSAITSRQSRHLYDMIEIYQSDTSIIENTELLEDVRMHKSKYFKRATSRWDLAVPGTIAIIPNGSVKEALNQDWNKMTDLFPNGQLPYTFDQMMRYLEEIATSINLSEVH